MSSFGNLYWAVEVVNGPTVYAYADLIKIQDGALVLMRSDEQVNACWAAGKWNGVWAASLIDGHYVAVEKVVQ